MKHAMFSIACVAILFSGCKGSHQEPRKDARGVEDVEILEVLPEKEKAGNSGWNTGDKNAADKNANVTRGMQDRDADHAIIQAIRRALADDAFLARYVAIRITSNNGEVVLRGVVETVQDKDAIEKRVKSLRAVKKVDNRLEVAPEISYRNNMR